MRDWIKSPTKSQHEALINEYKGNLLEYLIAADLSRHFSLEAQFQMSLGAEYRQNLTLYESELREMDPLLAERLPQFAQACFQEVHPILPSKIKGVYLVGKSEGQAKNNPYGEADILIQDREKTIPLSVKFSQSGSWINTKSGGIKSFIKTYFRGEEASQYQEELNTFVDLSFEQMNRELYEHYQLDYRGSFDEQWIKHNLSELPGQLEQEAREILQSHYHCIINKLYEFIVQRFEQDPAFEKSLFPLLGISHPSLIQVKCFHKKGNDQRYELAGVSIDHLESWKEAMKKLTFHKLKKNISYFEIELSPFVLQIRVKPMNKFTVPALKVNCSIREL